MKISDLCSREVYFVRRDEPLAEAAREMRKRHIGALVVAEADGEILRPVGIVTDRDIVLGQLARSADLFCLSVGDVMTAHPLVIDETCGLSEAIERLKARGVRRAPVVDATGALVGMISLDDLLPAVAEELELLAGLIGTQAAHERVR